MYYTFYFLESEEPVKFQVLATELPLLVNSGVSVVLVACTDLRNADLPIVSVSSASTL